MDEILKTLPTFGIGGILAAFMFWWYRKDITTYTARWEEQAKLNRETTERLIEILAENIKSQTHLSDLVKSLHNHLVYQEKLSERRTETRVTQ